MDIEQEVARRVEFQGRIFKNEIARLKAALARQDADLRALRSNADIPRSMEQRATLIGIIHLLTPTGKLLETLDRPLTDALNMVKALKAERDNLAEQLAQARKGES